MGTRKDAKANNKTVRSYELKNENPCLHVFWSCGNLHKKFDFYRRLGKLQEETSKQ